VENNQATAEKSTRDTRQRSLRRGIWLEAVTIGWNVLEGLIAIGAGVVANSVALVSFGVDSFVETTSAAVLFWRLRSELIDAEPENAERVERKAGTTATGIRSQRGN
jgi:divalent metal cation (Fe/Co/Zn/Cd) transporter